MNKIMYFDYCALILLITLIISTVFRKMTKGKLNKLFLLLLMIAIISVLLDIWAVWLDKMGPGNVTEKYIAHSAYLIIHNLMTPSYIVYLIAQTDTWHKLKQSNLLKILLILPITVATFLLIVNFGWHIVFYLDANDQYTRGSCFILLYVVGLIYVVFGVRYIIYYRKLFEYARFLSLLAMFPLMMVAVMCQFLMPGYLVEMFANAVSLLLVSMLIHRPEEMLDVETGLLKLGAYSVDMKRNFANEKSVQIIMINIVNYPAIRDMLGYEALSQMIHRIAARFMNVNRKKGLEADLYYLNNGKFRFVVEEKHFDQLEEAAEMINETMKSDFHFKHMEVNLVSCVCIAKCPEDISDVDSLLAFGDDLNTKVFTGEVQNASNLYKKEYYDLMRDLDRIIEQALADKRFMVYYQPIFSVKENRFNSAEALLRLKDEKYGFISPEIFIPAAEKSGAIHKIGAFVLDEVCQFIASEEYKTLDLDYIEINLSVAQCMQNSLADQILDMIKKYQISPSQINLEITETSASYSQKTMIDNLNILSNAGISFSLDDFGTGYSNMRRIASLPFQLVKLDKSFTDLEENPKLIIVLKNTINMIKALDMKIVVEGVETVSMVKQFSDFGCEYIQGYYYSKPIPKDEFIEFIRTTDVSKTS